MPSLNFDQGAFPPFPPSDLTDPKVIVDHDWQSFTDVDWMTDHWARPGWSNGRRAYYWMLTFRNAPRLLAQAQHCQSKLVHLEMDPVPKDGLHVTMLRVGDSKQVTTDQLQALSSLAEQVPLPSFEVVAYPLTASRGAVRYTLAPWDSLVHLHAALTDVGQRAGVPGGRPTSAFRPHLGIQYNNCDRPTEDVIASLEPLRALPPVKLTISRVDLVELRRPEEGPRTYAWDLVRSVRLRPDPLQSSVGRC